MACPEPEALLRYIDAETPADEGEEIRHHMEYCHDCRRAVGALQALARHLTRLAWAARPPLASTAACVDAMLLATYIEQRLTGPERQRVEAHISLCPDCRDALQHAEQRLDTVAVASRPVPAALLDKANALGTPNTAAEPPLWLYCMQQLRHWATERLPQPQWPWAWGGVAVAAALVLVVALSQLRTTPGPVVQTDPGPRLYGYGFGTPADVRFTGSMPLSPALRSALMAYNAAPTSAEARRQLLSVLGQAPLGLPGAQVTMIEIKPALQTLADRTDLSMVQVTLLQDGLLTIAVAP